MKSNRMKKLVAVLLSLSMTMAMCIAMTGCGDSGNAGGAGGNQGGSVSDAPAIANLKCESVDENTYAEGFHIYRYEGGYSVIDIKDEGQFLVVPEGKDEPEDIGENIKVLQAPVKNIYLGATAVMALFDSIDALDNISLSAVKASGWTVENAKRALEDGKMKYAGKYNQPDYEMFLSENCELAVESTMIYHSPEVQEMIEDIDVPVLVDRSSYESNPLGRTEWCKVYGVLTGHEEEATKFFNSQKEVIKDLENIENTGKTVAFFYVTTDGKVVVRSSTDYVSTMVSMAGGKYAFEGVVDDDGRTSVSMTMESFYDKAIDADYIIYNGSIDSSVKTIDDLIEKDEIFKKIKAVKEGKCWTTGNSLYQRTDQISYMILDFHKVLTEDNPSDLKFLTKME